MFLSSNPFIIIVKSSQIKKINGRGKYQVRWLALDSKFIVRCISFASRQGYKKGKIHYFLDKHEVLNV